MLKLILTNMTAALTKKLTNMTRIFILLNYTIMLGYVQGKLPDHIKSLVIKQWLE